MGTAAARRNSRATLLPPPAEPLVASPFGDCDPEEVGDWSGERGQSSFEGSPRNPSLAAVCPVQAQAKHSIDSE